VFVSKISFIIYFIRESPYMCLYTERYELRAESEKTDRINKNSYLKMKVV